MKTGYRFIIFILIFLCSAGATLLAYSIGKVYTLDELITEADQIVLVKHISSTPTYLGNHIATLEKFSVMETLKGPKSSTLQFYQAGGKLGNRDETIPGMPVYVPGEMTLLFLRAPKGKNRTGGPIGGYQGKFEAGYDSQKQLVIANRFLQKLQAQKNREMKNRATSSPSTHSQPDANTKETMPVLPDIMLLRDMKGRLR